MALEGGEFAKENSRYDAYHEAIFRAFFTDCKDIGKKDVILKAARHADLDEEALINTLDNQTYLPRLEETSRMAKRNRITAAPTFVINEHVTITGAQPIEKFRKVLHEA